jgi:alpha-D-ribose 1-methylphosphonate 5-triphosphate diphosphatase
MKPPSAFDHMSAAVTVVRGGRVLVDVEGLQKVDLVMSGGTILEIIPNASTAGVHVIDAEHCLVLPGIVDIHGDAFERNIMPRPKTMLPLGMAMLDTDRQLAANGITTAYHGITVSWEPGLRSVGEALRIVAALDAAERELKVDNRIHIRWETFAIEQVPAITQLFRRSKKPALAFNDHTSPNLSHARQDAKIRKAAERALLEVDAYQVLLQERKDRIDEVPCAIDQVAAIAREHAIPMLSHDDATVETRQTFRDKGVSIAEFPMNWETAEEAASHNDNTVFGAPNVVRGGSHNGAISAEEAIRRGQCTILASDYYYPAPLYAAFHLASQGTLSFEAAWSLISSSPAKAMGLFDRGVLAAGKRADLILIPNSSTRPTATIVAGELVYQSM